MAGLNLAVSGTTSTTYCATGGPLPTGYAQVPYGPGAPKWASDLDPAPPCSNPESPDSSCWAALELDQYVDWWWAANNNTCVNDLKLGFADCYYALAAKGYSPSTCGQINAVSGCKQPVWSDFQHLWNAQRAFYVAYNIWNINGFFSNYYSAINAAQGTATTQLQSIVNTLDPVAKTNLALNDILTVLSVGLAFVPGVGNALSKGLIIAAQQAPGVGKYIFPIGTADSQQTDAAAVSQSMGNVVTGFRNNYASALNVTNSDIASFLTFARNAPFSGKIPDLNSAVDQCLTALYTYILSQVYQVTNVILTRQVQTDVNALSSNGTSLNWETGCGKGYGQYGECSTFWYDLKTDISYALTDTQNQLRDFNGNMQQFFNGMTTGELLFAGADQCAQASKSNQGKAPIVDLTPGGSTASCLSNLQVCTWDLTAADKQPNPFTDCPSAVVPKFYGQACSDPYGDFSGGAVPIQYLGWAVLNNAAYTAAKHNVCKAYN